MAEVERIILLGNGFDLAHGLPTKYSDFMEYLKETLRNQKNKPFTIVGQVLEGEFENDDFFPLLDSGRNKDPWIGGRTLPELRLAVNPYAKPSSIFFASLIAEHKRMGSWADLESHYFKVLYKHREEEEKVKTINEEFDHLKKLLEKYLTAEVEEKRERRFNGRIYEIFNRFYPYPESFKKTHVVTFNYTATAYNYSSLENRDFVDITYVHGMLGDKNNPIIFGYGDENSEEYKELELLDNNELLKNFKTFQYLRTKGYKKVLGLLDNADEIFVQIIGQSCGLCDKALLRTIFHHPNVKKIEAIYHEKEDNFFQNLYNISRIFDDNTLMREKLISLETTTKI